MPGKTSSLTPLESRKQLLLAESELNRAQMVQEWQTMAGEVRALVHHARTLSYLAAAAVTVFTGLRSVVTPKAKPAAKGSWMQTILKGAGLLATLWKVFAPSDTAAKK